MIQPNMQSGLAVLENKAQPSSLHPPCQAACPIHQDAQSYLFNIARGDFAQAMRVVRETNPLPFVCGTICAHPCETQCRRGTVDQPLSIRALKRFAMEYGGNYVPELPPARSEAKAAIIGAGPAGLTAAHDLAKLGYRVTVFERESFAGGMPGLAIPLYRLPRDIIQKDVDAIVALGVEIKTNQELGKHFTVADLKKQGFKAILLGLGLSVSRGLPLPGIDSRDVWLALPFLRAVNFQGLRLAPDQDVIVVGGGNVAVDVARLARRAGAGRVRMVCLESPQEIPAFPWEIEEAREEGIDITCSQGPKCIIREDGNIACLQTVAVKAVFDAQGRFNPTFYDDRLSTTAGNMVILAIGQASDLASLKSSAVKVDDRGRLLFDAQTMTTSEEGVFAAGEVVTGPGSAVQAMASGRRAAAFMARYLKGESLAGLAPPEMQPLPKLESGVVENVIRLDRQKVPVLDVSRRIDNFNFIELGYNQQLAVREARRCLNCGHGASLIEPKCAICLTCVRVCPYGVPVVTPDGKVDIRVEQCQACGLCPSECPAKAIAFALPGVEEVNERMNVSLKKLKPHHANPAIVAFVCNYAAIAAPVSSKSWQDHASGVAVVTLPCIAKISRDHLIKAFEMGAEGVLLACSQEPDCIYQHTMVWAKRRLEAARAILKTAGIEPAERLEMLNLTTEQFQGFGEVLSGFVQKIKSLKEGASSNQRSQ